jgi:Na+/melibiose symporter-like transporter
MLSKKIMSKNISNLQIAAYAAPIMIMALMLGPAGSILQGVYTQSFGLKLEDIAVYLIIVRLFDAITDPAIGYLSDKTVSWPGGRKIWIVAGAIISVIGAYFLFIPPENVSAEYFLVFFLVCFLGWTMMEIPHLAWGNELSGDYDTKSKIFNVRYAFLFIGMWAFVSLPLLPIFETTEFNGDTLALGFWMILIGMPFSVYFALKYCPQGENIQTKSDKLSVKDMLSSMMKNKPFLIFCGVVLLIEIAIGMQGAIAFLHLTSFLALREEASIIYAFGFPVAIFAMPLWLTLAKKMEKAKAYALGIGVSGLGFLLLALLEPSNNQLWGMAETFWYYLAIFAFLQLMLGAIWSLPPALLGDVIDYGTLKTGKDQSGTYYAVFTFIKKSFGGLGGGIGLYIAASYGFEPSSTELSESAGQGVKLVMAYLPALLMFLALFILTLYPISKARHTLIRKKIAQDNNRRLDSVATS